MLSSADHEDGQLHCEAKGDNVRSPRTRPEEVHPNLMKPAREIAKFVKICFRFPFLIEARTLTDSRR